MVAGFTLHVAVGEMPAQRDCDRLIRCHWFLQHHQRPGAALLPSSYRARRESPARRCPTPIGAISMSASQCPSGPMATTSRYATLDCGFELQQAIRNTRQVRARCPRLRHAPTSLIALILQPLDARDGLQPCDCRDRMSCGFVGIVPKRVVLSASYRSSSICVPQPAQSGGGDEPSRMPIRAAAILSLIFSRVRRSPVCGPHRRSLRPGVPAVRRIGHPDANAAVMHAQRRSASPDPEIVPSTTSRAAE